MNSVDWYWNKFLGETCYIVGTGPSLRYFPLDFLTDKITIGLNQCHKYFCPKFGLTIHPELIPRKMMNASDYHKIVWITKYKDWLTPHNVPPDFVIFKNNKDVTDFSYLTIPQPGCLYAGRGIHTAALAFAAQAGFRHAVLVGCDFGALLGDHHGHDQHVRFHGIKPEAVYNEYYENAAKLRSIIREKYGMRIMSMSPFLGLDHFVHDAARLQTELNLPELSKPVDTSAYKRNKLDFSLCQPQSS